MLDADLIQRALLDTMSVLSGTSSAPTSSSTADSELTSTTSILQLFAELGKSAPELSPSLALPTMNAAYKPRKGSLLNADAEDLSPVELARKVAAERMRLRRANETPEEREIRLERMRQRYRARVANESEADKEARRRARRANSTDGSQASSSQGTPEPVAVPLSEEPRTISLSQEEAPDESSAAPLPSPLDALAGAVGSIGNGNKLKMKRLLETDDERNQRLERMREYQRRRLEKETPEQRERRLEKMRQNQRQRRERKQLEAQQAHLATALRALPQVKKHDPG